MFTLMVEHWEGEDARPLADGLGGSGTNAEYEVATWR
jgi:hypothetical protein